MYTSRSKWHVYLQIVQMYSFTAKTSNTTKPVFVGAVPNEGPDEGGEAACQTGENAIQINKNVETLMPLDI